MLTSQDIKLLVDSFKTRPEADEDVRKLGEEIKRMDNKLNKSIEALNMSMKAMHKDLKDMKFEQLEASIQAV